MLALGLGALALGFGVALPATAGYLISRAAEQPPILSLTTIVVAVRFLALARPLTRYARPARLARPGAPHARPVRARVYERIEPLAPAELGAFRRGDLLTRMVGDVDALQGLSLRGHRPAGRRRSSSAPPASSRRRCCCRPRRVVLAAGLVVGGVAVPLLAARAGARSARRQAAARGELTAELVELLARRAGARRLRPGGRDARPGPRRRPGARPPRRRDALVAGVADAASIAVCRADDRSVLALAVAAHDAGTLDRVLVATLALLALASFETVAPLPAAARELTGTLAAGRRVLELTAHEPAVRDPERPAEPPRPPISVVRPVAPPALDRVVRACLRRYPAERIQTAHDLMLDLTWLREGTSSGEGTVPTIPRRRRLWSDIRAVAPVRDADDRFRNTLSAGPQWSGRAGNLFFAAISRRLEWRQRCDRAGREIGRLRRCNQRCRTAAPDSKIR